MDNKITKAEKFRFRNIIDILKEGHCVMLTKDDIALLEKIKEKI